MQTGFGKGAICAVAAAMLAGCAANGDRAPGFLAETLVERRHVVEGAEAAFAPLDSAAFAASEALHASLAAEVEGHGLPVGGLCGHDDGADGFSTAWSSGSFRGFSAVCGDAVAYEKRFAVGSGDVTVVGRLGLVEWKDGRSRWAVVR